MTNWNISNLTLCQDSQEISRNAAAGRTSSPGEASKTDQKSRKRARGSETGNLGIRRRKIGNPNEEKLTKLGTVENLSNFHAKLLRHIGFAPPRVRGHRLARSLKSAAERRSARSSVMQDETELWMKLCVEAAIERDPHKFLEIAKEICELLKSKQKRLGIVPSKPGNCRRAQP